MIGCLPKFVTLYLILVDTSPSRKRFVRNQIHVNFAGVRKLCSVRVESVSDKQPRITILVFLIWLSQWQFVLIFSYHLGHEQVWLGNAQA